MVLSELLSQIFKAGAKDLRQEQRRRERERREQRKRKERIQELEGEEDEYEARKSLKSIPGVGSKTAGNLYEAGIKTAAQARSLSIEELKTIEGIGEKLAAEISREGAVKGLDLEDGIPFDQYLDAVETVKQLKREKRHHEAEKILLWCVEKAENERRPPPWYFKQLAIIYRKDGRYEDEVEIIEHYIKLLEQRGIEPEQVSRAAVKLVERVDRARELAEKDR